MFIAFVRKCHVFSWKIKIIILLEIVTLVFDMVYILGVDSSVIIEVCNWRTFLSQNKQKKSYVTDETDCK